MYKTMSSEQWSKLRQGRGKSSLVFLRAFSRMVQVQATFSRAWQRFHDYLLYPLASLLDRARSARSYGNWLIQELSVASSWAFARLSSDRGRLGSNTLSTRRVTSDLIFLWGRLRTRLPHSCFPLFTGEMRRLYVPVNSKTAHPPPLGIARSFDLSLAPYSRGFDPKWGPPGRAFDFRVKMSVSGRKQKDFAILSFSRCAAFTGHCSRRFHVGLSVVVVLYIYIVEYAFVQSLEWRQAEEEIRSSWKFCRICFPREAILLFVYSWADSVTECCMQRVIWQINIHKLLFLLVIVFVYL